jgi:hypothetical protein
MLTARVAPTGGPATTPAAGTVKSVGAVAGVDVDLEGEPGEGGWDTGATPWPPVPAGGTMVAVAVVVVAAEIHASSSALSPMSTE